MQLPIAKMARWGLIRFYGASRKQEPGMAALGAALAIIGWYRQRSGTQRSLLYRQTLTPGEEVKIVLRPDDRPRRRRR